MPTEDTDATMKYAMEHTTSSLPPTADLVPAAIADGRRRRRRNRALTAVAASCFVALAAVAVPAVWPEESSPTKVDPATPGMWLPPLTELTPAPRTYPIGPSAMNPGAMHDAPDASSEKGGVSAEDERLRGIYGNRVAAALERLLAIPGAIYEIDPDVVGDFDVVMPDGTRHIIVIYATARAHSLLEPDLRCDVPRMREPDRSSCVEHLLPNGTIARTYQNLPYGTASSPAGDVRYGNADITITIGLGSPLPALLTDMQVFTILTDPELLQLAEYLVTHKLYDGAKE